MPSVIFDIDVGPRQGSFELSYRWCEFEVRDCGVRSKHREELGHELIGAPLFGASASSGKLDIVA